jgi:hypothetical protein
MNTVVVKLAVFVSVVLGTGVATAQVAPHRGSPEEQRACGLDTRRHCREAMSQGDMAVLACLQQHRSKLTRACEAVLRNHGQ